MRSSWFIPVLCVPVCLSAQQVTIPADTPLRIAIDQQLRLQHDGEAVHAHLAAPVYLGERLVLPQGTPILGHIAHLNAVPKLQRAQQMAKGDFTPFKTADLRFDHLTLGDGTTLDIATSSATASGEVVSITPAGSKQSLMKELKATIRERKADALKTLKEESKLKRIEQRAILSLPYHPQWIEAGTRYDAVLTAPTSVTLPEQASAERSAFALPKNSTVHARFTNTINSAASHPGDPVTAVVTEPLFDDAHKLILPEGTLLHGEVQRAAAARWFGRGGQLRFRFTSIEVPGAYAVPQRISGQLTAAEGDPQSRLRMDAEGGTESVPAKNRFLAPLTLGVLATSSTDHEHGSSTGAQGALAGGFGITGRLISLGLHATPASSVFSYYALSQSLYSRWVARGKNVTFAKNTRLDVSFGER
ncbi:MAG: hypothetical protein NVS9B15_11280 [Acidobacteriaceae bacterium]